MTLHGFGRWVSWVALSVLSASSACKRREPTTLAAPVPAPARPVEVLAELCVPRPSELWPALQALLGPPVTFLPKAPELGLGGWLSLSPLVASSLDLKAPLVAVVLGGLEPTLVLGVHLESGPEFVAQLTTGNTPTHRVEREQGMSLLTALKSESASSLAVVGDALVVGSRTGVVRAGAYVSRSLLPKAAAQGPVTALLPGEALQTVGVPALRALWEKRRAGLLDAQHRAEQEHGRPADFAEPAAILAGADQLLESAFAVISSAHKVTAELALDEQGVELLARIWPKPAGVAEEFARALPVGPSDSLKALPASTLLGLLSWRAPEPAGRNLAASARALLGPRLAERDERALGEALTALDAGRGNVQTLAVLDDLSVVWRGEVSDAARMRRGLDSTLPWFTKKPVVEPVTALLGRPTLTQSSVRLDGVDVPVQRAVFRLTPVSRAGAKAAPSRQLEVASLIEPERFVLAAASGSAAPLGLALAAERGAASLGQNPQLVRWLGRAPRVSVVLFADLAGLGAPGAAGPRASAPLLFDAGVREGSPEFSVRASGAALRALLSRELAR